ncbi:oligosaccharide flippase family protein [Geodermatophilus chilensis]|uniref:oligosaccharide flippase family protein n=1 Tax=Geodermatophilus chilensis TaxID=2035835 RepID=UPI0013000BE5|nr:oligosaccharide flippase family protein [Geodermatophilus chilensis]
MSAVPPAVVPGDRPGTTAVDGALVSSQGPLVSASMGLVAVIGYAGALVLAHLLDAPDYSVYAAAATLLGTVGVFAAALVPMPLTHVIRTHPARSEERRRGIAFAWSVSAAGGVVAAAVTALVATAFAPAGVVAVVAASALVLFLASPVWGWFHGELRFVRNAVVLEAEIGARVLVGVGVVLLGWGAGGALTGFLAGSLMVLLSAPRALWRDLSWRTDVLRERARWAETGDIAATQLVVSTLVGADVVLVAALADPDAVSAGYQALATLAKAPVYVAAGAVAVAYPLLRSARARTDHIIGTTLRSFALLAGPAAAVVATVPPGLVLLVFPERYAGSLRLLPALAAAGVGYAALTLFTSVLLGLRAYRRCQAGLLVAALFLAAGLGGGWQLAGVPGLAAGTALGALLGAGGLWVAATPVLPPGTLRRARSALLAAAALTTLLAGARSVPALWVGAVLLLGGVVLWQLRRPDAVPTDELETS